MLLTGTNLID